ncbi:unnamed protein product [Spirodela intermedia]|uniref:Beta-hexosaminidase n=1 Tax=Spirodela intermedia TaxID=51605 RepID=A0A7I8IB02_SPIIN|nr:unnamed protein product [Spirodela intermedia]CAA6654879.1 unnamed protein product [Spirodela intermedia]
MPSESGHYLRRLFVLLALLPGFSPGLVDGRRAPETDPSLRLDESLVYLWPLPTEYRYGNRTLTVDPNLMFHLQGAGENSSILGEALERYRNIIFRHRTRLSGRSSFDLGKLTIIVASDDETGAGIQMKSIPSGGQIAKFHADTIYGIIRGLETFSQLCTFNYKTKEVEVHNAPWYISDRPRFPFRGLLIDTSRHYLPVNVIKQVIDSMSYAKLNVLHWHIVDEQSFPLEVPSYPDLWNGSYTKWERFTVEDAYELVEGVAYPDLWPSPTCREPLDVSKDFTFSVLSGILKDMHKIFPFELFHLGGDEVNADCWNSTPHVKQWLEQRNMTTKDAYQYFVLRAQEIAAAQNRTPGETFNTFAAKLHPQTVVHNWLVGSWSLPKVVAKGLRCIMSNQGEWYLDHLDPLEGIDDASQQKLVIGGEVCMWGETADTSDIQQTIWPRAAAAAERLWSPRETTSGEDPNSTALPRLEYFRCLLNRRGVAAAPVTNFYARRPPYGPGSCYAQ